MGLNVKLSLIVCLAFIVGMVWVVNEVGRPAKSVPTLAAAARTEPGARQSRPDRLLADRTAGKFQRASTAAEKAAPPPAQQSGEAVPAAPAVVAVTPVKLPPLHWPDAAEEAEPQTSEVAAAQAPALVEAGPAEVDDQANENNRSLTEPGTAVAGRAHKPGWPPTVSGKGKLMIQPEPEPSAKKYEVRKGDTLAKIAQQTLKSDDPKAIAAIVAVNPALKARHNKLLAGESLAIPNLSATASKSSHSSAGKDDAATKLVAKANTSEKAESPAQADRKGNGRPASKSASAAAKPAPARTYVVRANDSLAAIAKRVLGDERRWRELQQLNKLPANGRLQPGAKLRLPTEGTT